jgi:diacylglycerol kinase (ATP)
MWVTKLLKSFRYALEGLRYTVATQRNMRIHFLAALGVLFLSLYLPLSKAEVLVLFVTIVLVLFAELLNTAVEAVVDMVTEEFHPLAKIAKDVAAGAVLLTAGLAVIVGISIFYPYLDSLFKAWLVKAPYPANMGLAAIVALDFFLTLFLKGLFHRRGRFRFEPSMTASVSFCAVTLVILVIRHLFVALLLLLLLSILMGTRIRLSPHRLPLLLGAALGTLVALIGVQLL